MFLDSNGLIVQSSGDGGDSAQRTGFYFSAMKFRMMLSLSTTDMSLKPSDFTSALPKLITSKGLIRNPTAPYNNNSDTSRDQTRPMLIACGLWNFPDYVNQLNPPGLLLRFYPNGDLASPENWNEGRRALGKKPFIIGDVFSGGGAIIRVTQAKSNPDDVGDDLNTLLTLTFFYLVEPTFVSVTNLRYYLAKRPTNDGVTQLGEKDPVMGALAWYFRPASGGNPEIAEAWRPIIARLRSDLKV